MTSVYEATRTRRHRITLDVQALGDFNPHQIDFYKLFGLQENECVDVYVEDLDPCEVWW